MNDKEALKEARKRVYGSGFAKEVGDIKAEQAVGLFARLMLEKEQVK